MEHTDSPCEVRASRLGGQGTYATRNLDANTVLFRELAFLSAGLAATTPPPQQEEHDDGGHSRGSGRRTSATAHATPCLSTITVQHKHCPPCARLAPTDTGGSLCKISHDAMLSVSARHVCIGYDPGPGRVEPVPRNTPVRAHGGKSRRYALVATTSVRLLPPPSSLTHVNLERQDEASGKDQVHFAELRPSLEVNVVPPSSLRPATGLRRTGGSSDTYQFARAYSLSPVVDRQRVLALAAFGGADTHAIAEVVQAEVSLMRSFDDELRAIPASELESAIHR